MIKYVLSKNLERFGVEGVKLLGRFKTVDQQRLPANTALVTEAVKDLHTGRCPVVGAVRVRPYGLASVRRIGVL